ncbi:MAG TPA: hotdog fold domain-containing protein [Flexivirga sp.]|uniref:hotdog fold domain-containing protein n=1 Tax=Flexivirga sp. TaxID=1962927 RepID=UPI002BFFA246|nr:hotdog fold domain-containing protein [Flexivirga sp.]HWC24125.1 hotdog fold domain-containing protein [Flexivirga sp.]
MTSTYQLYQRLTAKPFGRQLFALGFMARAPYFATVQPQVREMAPNRGVVRIRKWRGVQNHIGTIHAIAVANGMEAAMGLLAEATVKPGTRWIPKGIQLEYITKVPSAVDCIAETDPADWDQPTPHEVNVRVVGKLADGTEVVRGVIPLWVTENRRS